MTERSESERAGLVETAVLDEVRRIKELFVPSNDDKEDAMTYAKEITALRRLTAPDQKPVASDMERAKDALFNIAKIHGYRLNDVELNEGVRAVARALYAAPQPAPGWDEIERELNDCESAVATIEANRKPDNETQNGNYRFYQGRVVSLQFALKALRRSSQSISDAGGEVTDAQVDRAIATFLEEDEWQRGLGVEDKRRRMRAALSKPAAADAGGGVRVKPLHWTRSKVFGFYKWRGIGVFGEFSAFSEGDMTPELIESAKGRIQADYEHSVLSALSKPAAADAGGGVREATAAQHWNLKGEPARFVRNGELLICECRDCKALSNPAAADSNASVEARPRWRHKKHGSTYTEVGRGNMQVGGWCNRTGPMDLPPVDMAEVVIYSGEDGRLWVRPVSEFEDGRFEALSPDPHASDCEKQGETP